MELAKTPYATRMKTPTNIALVLLVIGLIIIIHINYKYIMLSKIKLLKLATGKSYDIEK